jgi:hypothetical protein
MVACDEEVSVGGEQTRLKTRLSYSTRDLTALKLGLDLKFNNDTPAIIWEDVKVPMVPHGHWTPARIDEPPYDKQKPTSKRKAQVC